jgi:hypothetical protein
MRGKGRKDGTLDFYCVLPHGHEGAHLDPDVLYWTTDHGRDCPCNACKKERERAKDMRRALSPLQLVPPKP